MIPQIFTRSVAVASGETLVERGATVAAMLGSGAYPTPVELLSSLSSAASSLWIKRDDLSNATYGGNKVRKLGHLLGDATRRGAKRVVTVGGVGSHHVLATGIFAKQAGFRVDAAGSCHLKVGS